MLKIKLRYKGKDYEVVDPLASWSTDENNEPVEGDCYIWTEGNYSCDCNKSIFIREVFPDFPVMDCGDGIELIEMKGEKQYA